MKDRLVPENFNTIKQFLSIIFLSEKSIDLMEI
jgi:hypothetical protein